jgi:adenylate cyclase
VSFLVGPGAGPSVRVIRTVVFIDLAGYSALVDAHGDQAAVDVADSLLRITTEQLIGRGDLIKTIGDAVMLGFTTPMDALHTVAGILAELDRTPQLPWPSTGMHHGPVMERSGDLFGRRVNIAARLAGIAGPGEVLCTQPVAVAAAAAGIEPTERGALRLRNISDPIPAFALPLLTAAPVPVDPVCRMRVTETAYVLVHNDRQWRFCSAACADRFLARPDDFAN